MQSSVRDMSRHQLLPQLAQAGPNRGRVEHRPRTSEGGADLAARFLPGTSCVEHRLRHVPMGITPGGKRLANPGRPVTQADVAVFPHRVSKLDEPPVLLGHDESAGPLPVGSCGHQSSSK